MRSNHVIDLGYNTNVYNLSVSENQVLRNRKIDKQKTVTMISYWKHNLVFSKLPKLALLAFLCNANLMNLNTNLHLSRDY